MQKFIASAILILLFSGVTIAQNIGINNTDPQTALDINGGIRLRPVTSLVTGPLVNLVANQGHHLLNPSPGFAANYTISFLTEPFGGQHKVITNNTNHTATLGLIAIPPLTTVALIYSGSSWKMIGSSGAVSSNAWSLTGNAGTDTSVNFIGNTDNMPLGFKVNNVKAGLISNGNLAFGMYSLPFPSASAVANTAIGTSALSSFKNGNSNIALGYGASPTPTKVLPPNYTLLAGFEYQFEIDGPNILITNKGANSANIGSKPYRMLITYEE